MSGASVQRRQNTLISVREIFWKRSGRGFFQWDVTLLRIQDVDPVWVLLQPVRTQRCSTCFTLWSNTQIAVIPSKLFLLNSGYCFKLVWWQVATCGVASSGLKSSHQKDTCGQIAVVPLKCYSNWILDSDWSKSCGGGKWFANDAGAASSDLESHLLSLLSFLVICRGLEEHEKDLLSQFVDCGIISCQLVLLVCLVLPLSHNVRCSTLR